MIDLEFAAEMQGYFDELDLVSLHVDDVARYLRTKFKGFTVETGSHMSNPVGRFNVNRVRVWFDPQTERVIAVMHG
jgi:hypothetical protein